MKFRSFGIEPIEPSYVMVGMGQVFLTPSCICKSSKLILAVYCVSKSVLLHVLITGDILRRHKRLRTLYAHLVVIFNLKVLVGIVKDAWQVFIPLLVVFIILINYFRFHHVFEYDRYIKK